MNPLVERLHQDKTFSTVVGKAKTSSLVSHRVQRAVVTPGKYKLQNESKQ